MGREWWEVVRSGSGGKYHWHWYLALVGELEGRATRCKSPLGATADWQGPSQGGDGADFLFCPIRKHRPAAATSTATSSPTSLPPQFFVDFSRVFFTVRLRFPIYDRQHERRQDGGRGRRAEDEDNGAQRAALLQEVRSTPTAQVGANQICSSEANACTYSYDHHGTIE